MPKRCLDCDRVTLPNDSTGKSVKQCSYCLSTKLECDHPSSSYSKEKRCFICGTCGYEDHNEVERVKKHLNANPTLSKIFNLLS